MNVNMKWKNQVKSDVINEKIVLYKMNRYSEAEKDKLNEITTLLALSWVKHNSEITNE